MTCCCKISETTWRLICFFTVCYLSVKEILTSTRTYSTDSMKPRLSHATDFRVIPFTSSPTRLLPTSKDQPDELKPQEQVLVALRFFASGSFLEVVGDTVGGIPKCTISRIVSRVSTALVRKQHEFIRWPSTDWVTVVTHASHF